MRKRETERDRERGGKRNRERFRATDDKNVKECVGK